MYLKTSFNYKLHGFPISIYFFKIVFNLNFKKSEIVTIENNCLEIQFYFLILFDTDLPFSLLISNIIYNLLEKYRMLVKANNET